MRTDIQRNMEVQFFSLWLQIFVFTGGKHYKRTSYSDMNPAELFYLVNRYTTIISGGGGLTLGWNKNKKETTSTGREISVILQLLLPLLHNLV